MAGPTKTSIFGAVPHLGHFWIEMAKLGSHIPIIDFRWRRAWTWRGRTASRISHAPVHLRFVPQRGHFGEIGSNNGTKLTFADGGVRGLSAGVPLLKSAMLMAVYCLYHTSATFGATRRNLAQIMTFAGGGVRGPGAGVPLLKPAMLLSIYDVYHNAATFGEKRRNLAHIMVKVECSIVKGFADMLMHQTNTLKGNLLSFFLNMYYMNICYLRWRRASTWRGRTASRTRRARPCSSSSTLSRSFITLKPRVE